MNSCLLPELVGKWWTSSSARLSRRLITAAPGCLSGTPTAPKVTATAACGAPSPTPAPSSAVCPEAAPMKVGRQESTFTSQTTPVLSYSTPSSLSLEGNCSVPISCRFCTITTPLLVVCVCYKCGIGYHHMCQSLNEEGQLYNVCFHSSSL